MENLCRECGAPIRRSGQPGRPNRFTCGKTCARKRSLRKRHTGRPDVLLGDPVPSVGGAILNEHVRRSRERLEAVTSRGKQRLFEQCQIIVEEAASLADKPPFREELEDLNSAGIAVLLFWHILDQVPQGTVVDAVAQELRPGWEREVFWELTRWARFLRRETLARVQGEGVKVGKPDWLD